MPGLGVSGPVCCGVCRPEVQEQVLDSEVLGEISRVQAALYGP